MEKSEFLSFFYKHSMHVMTAPLFATTCDDKPSKGEAVTFLNFVLLEFGPPIKIAFQLSSYFDFLCLFCR